MNVREWVKASEASDRAKRFMNMRLKGETLQEIGTKEGGLSRERVRQILEPLTKNKPELDEDKFEALYWFQKYSFLNYDYMNGMFDLPEETYNYYDIFYRRNKKNTKATLLKDKRLTDDLRTKFRTLSQPLQYFREEHWHEYALETFKWAFDTNPHGGHRKEGERREHAVEELGQIFPVVGLKLLHALGRELHDLRRPNMLPVAGPEAQYLPVDRVAEHLLHIGPGLVGRGGRELLRRGSYDNAHRRGDEETQGALPVSSSENGRGKKIRKEKNRDDPDDERGPLNEDVMDDIFFFISQKLKKPGFDHGKALLLQKAV